MGRGGGAKFKEIKPQNWQHARKHILLTRKKKENKLVTFKQYFLRTIQEPMLLNNLSLKKSKLVLNSFTVRHLNLDLATLLLQSELR